jgi:predicted permease
MANSHIKLGIVEQAKEKYRDRRGLRWLESLMQDVRFGLRMLRKSPGFTAVAILTLALGIGANTAIFSLVDAVMLRMLPVEKPEELMMVGMRSPRSAALNTSFTNPIWEQVRERQDVFSGVFAWSPSQKFDLSRGGELHTAKGVYVSGDYFHTLGARPAAGRLLAPSDDERGCAGVVVLSNGFWREHYDGTSSAIDSLLSLNGHSFQVIGVAPPGFFGLTVGQDFDVAVPVCAEAIITGDSSVLDERATWWLNIMGRPKPGLSAEKVTAGLEALSSGIFAATVSQHATPDRRQEFLARSLLAFPAPTGLSDLRRDYNEPLKMLMVVVGLVLFIACANIASLMLARAATRSKEIAVRLAVGASRPRLIRQLLTECVMLSFAGTLVGMLFARWGCVLLVRFISTTKNPVFLSVSIDSRILAFTAGIAVLTGLLFGVLPAFRSTQVSLASTMKQSHACESEGRALFGFGRWIVASQVALSLVLVIVAGLLLRSFTNLLKLDAGFDRSNVLLVYTNVHDANVPPNQRAALYQQMLDRLNSLPGAMSASVSLLTPISGDRWRDAFSLEYGGGPGGEDTQANLNYVSSDYFATLRSPILTGRNFDERDTSGSPLVAIINETMVHRFFPQSRAIGEYLRMDNVPGTRTPPVQVIGILKDAKYVSLREATPSTIYFPFAQLQSKDMTWAPCFEIRTASPPWSLARPAELAITGLNSAISLSFNSLESQVDDSLRQDELLATLSSFFGVLALILSMIGLYGVLAYMVTQRRKEIGIRMALGAGRGSILRLVLRDVSVPVLTGVGVGIGISLWATQLVQKMLFELDARDAKTIVLAVAVLAVAALFAVYLPARNASRLDPMAILRDE